MSDINKLLNQCPECGLHYQDQETAKQCEAFCKEHSACSLEITQYSIESKNQNGKDLAIEQN